MNKPTTVTILTSLRWRLFFLLLLPLIIQMIPRAVGQRDADTKSWDAKSPVLQTHEMLKQQSVPSTPLEPAGCASWAPTGSLNTARDSHSATLLPNGRVLVAGGFGPVGASAELYDMVLGTWTPTGSLNTGR